METMLSLLLFVEVVTKLKYTNKIKEIVMIRRTTTATTTRTTIRTIIRTTTRTRTTMITIIIIIIIIIKITTTRIITTK